jgi:hypothetical protein
MVGFQGLRYELIQSVAFKALHRKILRAARINPSPRFLNILRLMRPHSGGVGLKVCVEFRQHSSAFFTCRQVSYESPG